MEPISFSAAFSFFDKTTLKSLREQEGLVIPEWYITSSKRLLLAGMTYSTLLGILLGMAILKL